MLRFLTADHQPYPLRVRHQGGEVSTSALIRSNDLAALAQAGVYRHLTAPGDAPLGYTDWAVSSDADGPNYVREPAGTAEERTDDLTGRRRQERQAERQTARLAAQTGGFTFDGHRYASDREESIPLLTAATIAAQSALAQGPEATAAYEAALGAGWRSEDGVARIASAVGILSLHAAFVAHGAACDRHSQALKAQIDAAASVAELDAIDLSAGWPG